MLLVAPVRVCILPVYSAVVKRRLRARKRAALRSLDPNIQPAKRVRCSNTGPQPVIQAPLLPNLPVEPPLDPPEPQPPHAPATVLPLPNPPPEPQPPHAPATVLPLPNPPLEPQPPHAPVTVPPPPEPTGFLPSDE